MISISNHRIKSMTDTTVTYVVKDYKNEGCWKEKTISGEEFIRRFMMHVPPKRFVRIRHYGLLSCRNKRKKITHCRNLLGCKKYISTLKNLNAVEMIRVLYHIDVSKCSSWGGNMVSPRKDKYSSSFRAHMRCYDLQLHRINDFLIGGLFVMPEIDFLNKKILPKHPVR